MEVTAKLKHARISPQKCRLVADQDVADVHEVLRGAWTRHQFDEDRVAVEVRGRVLPLREALAIESLHVAIAQGCDAEVAAFTELDVLEVDADPRRGPWRHDEPLPDDAFDWRRIGVRAARDRDGLEATLQRRALRECGAGKDRHCGSAHGEG